jgi:hypothetical protein
VFPRGPSATSSPVGSGVGGGACAPLSGSDATSGPGLEFWVAHPRRSRESLGLLRPYPYPPQHARDPAWRGGRLKLFDSAGHGRALFGARSPGYLDGGHDPPRAIRASAMPAQKGSRRHDAPRQSARVLAWMLWGVQPPQLTVYTSKRTLISTVHTYTPAAGN